jgi:two-component system, NtrC family, sensor histidine kinase PilS
VSDQKITSTNAERNVRTPDAWYRLRLFNYFRASLSLLFITIYLNNWLLQLVPSGFAHTELFITVAVTYLVASLIFIPGIFYRRPSLNTQVIIHSMVDIVCIILLIHATGGIRSGLGMLLIISISMTSLFLPKRAALGFAAISASAVIAEQIYSQLSFEAYSASFTQAGLLGILIFISAFITLYSAKKLSETEKLAEQKSLELAAIQQLNEHIIKHMRTGILVIENNGKVLMANNAALELLGNTTINPETSLETVSSVLYARFADWLKNDTQNQLPIQQEQGMPELQPGFSHIKQDRSHEDEGRTLIFLEDATQLSQRFQQVKLASLGRLTASIAHEIRNPLAAINHAGQLLAETAEDDADKKLTGIIKTQANRLNSIVENVLQLSRQQRGTPEVISLEEWLRNFREEFVSSQSLQAYQIQIKIAVKDVAILFDASQLHQVMWNLFINAITHSRMKVSNVMINIQGDIDHIYKQPYIDIIDNGPGIDKESQSHIFDPFFTTSSEGTGLGLYLTKEVVENNRGKIRFIAPPTGGTCFRIYFQQAVQ